jgi:hypothetical protein
MQTVSPKIGKVLVKGIVLTAPLKIHLKITGKISQKKPVRKYRTG